MADGNILWHDGASGIYQLTESTRHSEKEQENEIEREENNDSNYITTESELVYTVEDAIEHMGFGPFQLLVTLFSGMIWVCKSYDIK